MTSPRASGVPWSIRAPTFSWSGLAVGPAAWAIDTQLNYALVDWACAKGSNPTPVIAAVFALISVGAAASSFVAWQRQEGPAAPELEQDGHPQQLLAGVGVAAGLLFAVVIAMQGLAGLLLEPCLR
jgi:hypothetical protein